MSGSELSAENARPVRDVHYEGRNLRERLTACVEMWQSTGPKQQSTRDLLTDLIGVLGEYDPDEDVVAYLRRFPATEGQRPGIDAALVWLELRGGSDG